MASKIITILSFHRVSDEYSPAYPPIPTKVFDKICRYISKKYEVIHPDQLFEQKKSKKPKLLITFDDAYMDFKECAYPILKKYNLPVVQHVITQCAETGESFWTQRLNKIIEQYFIEQRKIFLEDLGIEITPKTKQNVEKVALDIYRKLLPLVEREQYLKKLESGLKNAYSPTPMLQWEDIKALNQDENIVFGSHTCSHENLTMLDSQQIELELKNSKDILQTHLGEEKNLFLAYPNGQVNELVARTAKKVGYSAAFTTEAQKYAIEGGDQFFIPRYLVYRRKWWKNWVFWKMLRF